MLQISFRVSSILSRYDKGVNFNPYTFEWVNLGCVLSKTGQISSTSYKGNRSTGLNVALCLFVYVCNVPEHIIPRFKLVM